jgi:uncharacterized OB-fold protein
MTVPPGVPDPSPDADSAPFWKALRDHRLAVERCDECGTFRFPPGPVCRSCRSVKSTWTDLSGRGRVVSWVVVHHAAHPAFTAQAPYTVMLVELDEQPGLVVAGNLRPSSATVTAGMPVRVMFEDESDDLTLAQWTPMPAGVPSTSSPRS